LVPPAGPLPNRYWPIGHHLDCPWGRAGGEDRIRLSVDWVARYRCRRPSEDHVAQPHRRGLAPPGRRGGM